MREPLGTALARVGKVLIVYAVAATVLWGFLPGIQRTFLLPQLFGTVARGSLFLGAAVAAVVAWRYPRLGTDERDARAPGPPGSW